MLSTPTWLDGHGPSKKRRFLPSLSDCLDAHCIAMLSLAFKLDWATTKSINLKKKWSILINSFPIFILPNRKNSYKTAHSAGNGMEWSRWWCGETWNICRTYSRRYKKYYSHSARLRHTMKLETPNKYKLH